MFENSKVTFPSQPGSKGVTLTIIPHLAYVDLPKQITRISFGTLKYSTVLASANEFGGITHSLHFLETKLFFLIGADNLIKFHKWKKWKKIPQLAKIVVFARSSYSIKALNSIASKRLEKKDWIYINSKKMNISSSLIKKF